MSTDMRLDHVPAEVGERQLSPWHGLLIAAMAVVWIVAAATAGGTVFFAVSFGVVGVVVLTAVLAPARRRRSNVVARWAAEHGWRYHLGSADAAGSSRNLMTRTEDGVDVMSYEALATSQLRSGKDDARRARTPRVVARPGVGGLG